MESQKDWFKSWFNTKYYHILYKDRNYNEAQLFLDKLMHFLTSKPNAKILDLACGKGRHSIYLNKLGFDVIGADLSENSINYAKKFENETLKFEIHDMRHSFETKFDVILNLFTSFGFFEDDNHDIEVLKHIKNGLKPKGIAVIDFMNASKVVTNLVPHEKKEIDGILFTITREIKNGFIVKNIAFEIDSKEYSFFERVKILDLNKINSFLNRVNFKIKYTFGNYNLDSFNEKDSDRLILILE